MTDTKPDNALRALPSVDKLLGRAEAAFLIDGHGRRAVVDTLRATLETLRRDVLAGDAGDLSDEKVIALAADRLEAEARSSLTPVFNLTGTVIHTNLGRAPMPAAALAAIERTAQSAANVEYDLDRGKRGDRDDHLENLICRLTGAEAATTVNNNAAAVLLVLNTLAQRKEVPVSRGELIEIGGSFRIPDIMKRAGCKLVEVGTTNRTHLKDFAGAVSARTALLMKVHTSNYAVEGFTKAVPEEDMAALAREHGLPFIVDLGSGTLVDFRTYGLPYEPTPQDTLKQGADLVTFSGDKLLGGPQAGIIAGRADLVAKIKKNPMKRALRNDKMIIAALDAVLRLYLDPDRLCQRLPVLRLLTRPVDDIRDSAERLAPALQHHLGDAFTVAIEDCQSQIGSGSLPVERLPSAALALTPTAKRGSGAALKGLAVAFRQLPRPVIGRIHGGAFILDLRCLEDEAAFLEQLQSCFDPKGPRP
ncbi:MAG: L-seryl-tRNA(Sec) selenium transferase [Rhodospirillales bacterium]|nr:L-seryl-tRNA(Sec) selenium transferase [Rhodospirillales bacterium]